MLSKKIIAGGIGAAVAVAVVILSVVYFGDMGKANIVDFEKEEHITIANKPQDVLSMSAEQYGNELSLSMIANGTIPQSLDELSLSESAIGFGYGWFGPRNIEVGHLEGAGTGHLKGYIVILNAKNSTANINATGWEVQAVRVDVALGNWPVNYCMKIKPGSADLQIQENKISIKTPSDVPPNIKAFFVDRIASFELKPEQTPCHLGQLSAKTIDINFVE